MDARRLALALLFFLPAGGASGAPSPRPEPTPLPEVEVTRATGPVAIDGRLDEAAWRAAPPYTRFLQRDPDEGQPASEKTELRLLYDDGALYVGARLFDREADLVGRRLSRRDDASDADRFAILLDPRRDRLTGVRFEVTAAGVQRDQVIFNDTWTDESWDAVWDSAVTVDGEGWTVEMRIPFSELRFMRGDHQTWGVNALRFIARKNESDWLALVSKRESGLASRMATLTGLRGVEPRTPLVLVPYVAGSAESAPRDAADPFHDGTAWGGSAGLDLRRKIGAGFALDATVNPDFGQVEVDPAVVNLSDFETFFPERRPFFVEGAQIFDSFGRNGPNNYYYYNRSEPDLFYTRRIGRAPQGSVDAPWVDAPRTTTILGAAKLTGKTADGWSVGVLEALTGREEAAWQDGGDRGRRDVEPLTNHFVARAFRDRGRAGFGGLLTSVARDVEDDALAAALARSATIAGLDGYVYLDEGRDWVVAGRVAASRVGGSREAIEALQLSSARYFQRPDRKSAVLDPERTSLGGWTGSVDVNRQSGTVRVNASTWATSPGFDSNDLGFNPRSDRWGGHVAVQLQQPAPDGFTRFRALTVAKSYSWNFDGDKQADAVSFGARLRLRNYWDLGLDGSYRWRGLDDRQTRGGPSMATARSWNGGLWGGTDGRKPVVGRAHAYLFRNEWGSWQWETTAALEMRPSSAMSLSVGPSVTQAHRVAQWVAAQADAALAPDLGGHYVFAGFDQRELALALRLSWIFSPRLSLQMYAQPLLSRADYSGFRELARARSFDFVVYGPDEIQQNPATGEYVATPGTGGTSVAFADPDFSFKSLRVNTVLRWEWRPGSALYAVWTQARENSEDPQDADVGRSLDVLLGSPATNVFEVKATFRLGD